MSFLILSSILLSACNANIAETPTVTSPANQNIQLEKSELTDDQLLDEIDSTSSSDIDAQFSQLENEIK